MVQEIFPEARFQVQNTSLFNSFGVKTASGKVVVNSYPFFKTTRLFPDRSFKLALQFAFYFSASPHPSTVGGGVSVGRSGIGVSVGGARVSVAVGSGVSLGGGVSVGKGGGVSLGRGVDVAVGGGSVADGVSVTMAGMVLVAVGVPVSVAFGVPVPVPVGVGVGVGVGVAEGVAEGVAVVGWGMGVSVWN